MSIVAVTGASGRAGRAVVRDLVDHGHQVLATDIDVAPADLPVRLVRADLTDYGQVVDLLNGVEKIVHLANIPAPGLRPSVLTYNANTTMNANVFFAASQLGVERVVWASSETTLGLPFDTSPRYAPVDEDHYPLPTSTYALSKVVGETTARHVADLTGIPFVALRFSNILGPAEYEHFPTVWRDPIQRKWNLWGYVDDRDVAQACRLSLDAGVSGAESFIIAAADTVMDRPSRDVLAEVYPDVAVVKDIGAFETLLSIDRARAVLGYAPEHSWRDHL